MMQVLDWSSTSFCRRHLCLRCRRCHCRRYHQGFAMRTSIRSSKIVWSWLRRPGPERNVRLRLISTACWKAMPFHLMAQVSKRDGTCRLCGPIARMIGQQTQLCRGTTTARLQTPAGFHRTLHWPVGTTSPAPGTQHMRAAAAACCIQGHPTLMMGHQRNVRTNGSGVSGSKSLAIESLITAMSQRTHHQIGTTILQLGMQHGSTDGFDLVLVSM